MAITPITVYPQSTDPAGEFAPNGDAFIKQLATQFVPEANALEENVNALEATFTEQTGVATAQAAIATSQAGIAMASANYKGLWAGLSGSWPKGISVGHNGSFWALNDNLADISSSEPSTSNNAWSLISPLPMQSGNTGKILTTNGSLAYWTDNITFKQISEIVYDIGSLTGGSYAINLSNGLVQSLIVSSTEQTFTFTNPSNTGTNTSFALYVTNGGSQVVNWPTTVKWPDGESPDLTAAGLDVIVFSTKDAGTNWYGFIAGLDVK